MGYYMSYEFFEFTFTHFTDKLVKFVDEYVQFSMSIVTGRAYTQTLSKGLVLPTVHIEKIWDLYCAIFQRFGTFK